VVSARRFVRIALGAACYAVIARLGLGLDAVGGLATLVWPPTGLALAALVVFGRDEWPAVALGALVANLWVGAPPLVAAGIAVGNTLEAVIGAALVTRAGAFRRSLDDLRSVARLVVFAALLSTLVSASGGTLSMVLAHVVPATRAARTWHAWWVGDMMGDLVVAPLVLTLTVRDDAGRSGSRAEASLLCLLFALTLALVFGRSESASVARFREPHVLMPLLIWASVRFGPRGAATATFFASAAAITGTTLGRGPFLRGSLHESLLAVQSFMGVVAVTFLFLAAVTAERRRLLVRERAARAEAEQAVKAREAFLAVASHELRTPLTPLELELEALLRSPAVADATLRRRLERAKRQSSRLARHVEALLDASRLAAGKLDLDLEPCDGRELAREVLEQARSEAERAGSTLTLEVSGPTDGSWDRHRVAQALSNLVANAVKFGAGRPVNISLQGSGERLVIACTDHGIGIEPSLVDAIFERFERAPASRQHGGLGLGLYVAREIARAHGGDITVESSAGHGATFNFWLPRGEEK
jgi:signal transduction histidine kinase